MVRLVIPLSAASADALARLARREHRAPRMQAKLLLERAIHELAGALPHVGKSDPLVTPESDQPKRAELADAGAAR